MANPVHELVLPQVEKQFDVHAGLTPQPAEQLVAVEPPPQPNTIALPIHVK